MPLTYRPPPEIDDRITTLAFLSQRSKQSIIDQAVREFFRRKEEDRRFRATLAKAMEARHRQARK